ncbi:MAG: hypothetical protein AAFS10_19175, partial [Myxococcota bacterium]
MKDLFRQTATAFGLLSAQKSNEVWDFHCFEGKKRHPADVAVSLGMLNAEQAKTLKELMETAHNTKPASPAPSGLHAKPAFRPPAGARPGSG